MSQFYDWHKGFNDGREIFDDDPHSGLHQRQ
jgi:hypothetical protein